MTDGPTAKGTPGPAAGDIWRYPYLWAWQAERGETEGRKPRPVTLAAVIPIEGPGRGRTRLYLLAITGTPPGPERTALEIPATEIRRAGLDAFKQLWIVLDEFNRDVLEASFYFEPGGRIGAFSKAFRRRIADGFLDAYRAGGVKHGIERSE